MNGTPARVLLAGGGHSHIEVLRRFALLPEPSAVITLVNPHPMLHYSGMLPGLVAGHYSASETNIALPPLARNAQARFVRDHVVSLDLEAKTARLASGAVETFDLVSFDVGSAPDMRLPGAELHAIGIKPIAAFLAAWERLQSDAAYDRVHSVAVVGGGAGGIEILLAMQWRLASALGDRAPRFALVGDQPNLLPNHSPAVRRRLGRILVARDVVLHLGRAAAAIEAGAILTVDGRRIAADRIIFATPATAQPWLAASGLACDANGFLRVDPHLRSVSHPFAFAGGDCASMDGNPRPKSGVFAVRHGPPLAANLRAAILGKAMVRYRPQRAALALIATGGRHAVAARGPVAVEGDALWRWKDRIDRKFVAKYRVPE